MSAIIGVWAAAGSGLLAEVQDGTPLLRLTLRRCKAAALPLYCLIPWSKELDHLEADVKRWGFQTRRTHTDDRIAMRDLVAEFGAETGLLVRAQAAAIDVAEINLACARLKYGWDEYVSERITAYPIQRWLKVSDTAEWPGVLDWAAAKALFHGQSLEGSARALAARKAEPLKND